MSHHIQPIARKLGTTKHIGWHTFRRTDSSILKDNEEDVKVLQELLRHASTKVTLEVYAGTDPGEAGRPAQGRRERVLSSKVSKGE